MTTTVGYQAKTEPRSLKARFMALLLFTLYFTVVNAGLTAYIIATFQWPRTVFQHPFLWIPWSLNMPGYEPIFQPLWLGFLFSQLLGLFAVYLTVRSRLPTGNATAAGTARFAQREDMEQASLLGGDGVYVGGWEDNGTLHYLRHNGPEHVLGFAPTRSGKGVGLVLPTLLSWPESVITLDIKGELYDETSGWRSQEAKNIVLRFDPARLDSVGFNPLEEVRISKVKNGRFEVNGQEVSDAQNIALMLANPDGNDKMDHFQLQAYSLIVALILHNCYKSAHTGETASLADLGETLKDPDTLDIYALFSKMMTFPHLATDSSQEEVAYTKEEMDELMAADKSDTHPVVLQTAADMFKKADRELASIISTASACFNLFLDPVVARNTQKSDFRIDQLRNHSRPLSLYVVTRPNDIDRLKPLSRILFTLFLKRSTETLDKPKHRCLMMMDEFTSMGKLQALEDSIAYVGGYGIKIYLIVQDVQQLYKAYGREETLISNCHIRIAYAPNKPETAKLLSDMAGVMTVSEVTTTVSGKRFGAKDQISHGITEKSRPLLTPDECLRLPSPLKDADGLIIKAGKMLIFAAGFPPVWGTQILWFLDPVFKTRHASAGGKMQPPCVASQTDLIDPEEYRQESPL